MIKVLRLGHRAGRDDRISTHVGLTARQWGVSEIVYSGQHDQNMMDSLEDIIDRWGGDFQIDYTDEWKKEIRNFGGLKVHLTMYGERIDEKMEEIEDNFEDRDLLVIVGAEKSSSLGLYSRRLQYFCWQPASQRDCSTCSFPR